MGRLHLDGFAAERSLVVSPEFDPISFIPKHRAPHPHETALSIEGLPAGEYTVICGETARTFRAWSKSHGRVIPPLCRGPARAIRIRQDSGPESL